MSEVADGNNHKSSDLNPDSERPFEYEISDRLFQLPIGHHYLILYSDITSMRNVYANFIKRQMEEQPDSVVLFLSYYDTTNNVRSALESKELPVKIMKKMVL